MQKIFVHFNDFLLYLTILIIFSISCALEYNHSKENYEQFEKIEGFKVINHFSVKGNIYTANCDLSGNKLLIKFSKNGDSWKRTKYITRGC